MNILRFLREQAKEYKCSVCGANHSGSDIRVLGKLESAWIVRVTCAKCQTAFKLLVVVDEQRAAVSPVKKNPSARVGRRSAPTRSSMRTSSSRPTRAMYGRSSPDVTR